MTSERGVVVVGARCAGAPFAMLLPRPAAMTGLSPITTYLELARQPHNLQVDEPLCVRFSAWHGFVHLRDDEPPRYGGTDLVEFTDRAGTALGRWRQHWLWHRKATGELLSQPAPHVPTAQDQQLAPPPRRPRLERPSGRRPFRWTSRETDANQHINVVGYLERAENAAADARWGGGRNVSAVRLWFRRPAFLDDSMFTQVDLESDPLLVQVHRQDPERLCATLTFSAQPPSAA